MQRIEALIEKLRTQFKNKAELSQLLLTTQMIQREIHGAMKETAVLGTSNVAVLVPNLPTISKNFIVRDKNGGEKEYFQLDTLNEADADEEELRLLELQYQAGLYDDEPQPAEKQQSVRVQPATGFDPLLEVPTLFQQLQNGTAKSLPAQQPQADEVNEVKSPQIIQDLTKDITAADKERFIKNLFRGDEVMYNRSIKTINNFNTLDEAEYWVMRELKTKLGWISNSDVEYFDRLVYRKFS